jgi:glycosyltransferase involved in cell wall biosynthesis
MKKVLVLGNIPKENVKSSVGGATVLLKNILSFFSTQNNFEFVQFQLRYYWGKNKLIKVIDGMLILVRNLIQISRFKNLSIHATYDYTITFGLITVLYSRFLNRKISYHLFGGKMHEFYSDSGKWKKAYLKLLFSSVDVLWCETKIMKKYFLEEGFKANWLPNARPKTSIRVKNTDYRGNFVFVSRVTPTKGIDQIMKVFKELPSYKIDIFGPLDLDYYSNDSFDLFDNINYRGLIEPKRVPEVLSQYDFLVLPTYHPGEGYPGIVIEAFSVGLPSIISNWRAIPEIIENGYNGVLVDIEDDTSLITAIDRIDLKKFN